MLMMVISKNKLKKIIIYILVIVFIIGGILFTFRKNSPETLNLLQMASEPYIRGTNKNSGYVAITCNVDLGWDDEYLQKILDILDEENIKITFAVTGKWAQNNKDELLNIKSRGHQIANHGYQHLGYNTLSYDENFNQIKKSKDIIDNITGEQSDFFQAPSGSFNEDTIKAANNLGYTCYKWDIDTVDWMDKDNPQKIINRVKRKNIQENSIVLIHPTKAITICLDEIISMIRTSGYIPGRLDDVFK